MKRYIIIFLGIVIFGTATNLYSADSLEKKIQLGNNLMVLHKYIDAANEYAKVLAIDKNHPDALFNKSLCHYYLYEYDTASKYASHLLKISPQISDVHNLYGLIKLKLKDTAAALESFTKAIKIDNNFPEPLLNRAKILVDKKDYNNAYKDILNANNLDTNNAEIYYYRARIEHQLNKFVEAIDNYTKALLNGRVNPETFMNRANSYYKNKNYQDAINDYSQVIYQEPLNFLAYNNRAFAFEDIGDSVRAINDRLMVSDIYASDTLKPESATLKLFSDKDSSFTISLPDFLVSEENKYKDSTIVLFVPPNSSKDKGNLYVGNNAYRLTGRIKIVPFFSKMVGASEPAESIESWRMMQDTSEKKMFRYEKLERKTKPYRTFPSITDRILYQKEKYDVPAISIVYAVVYGEHLIEMNFAFPLPLYNYYNQIIQQSLDSFNIIRIM